MPSDEGLGISGMQDVFRDVAFSLGEMGTDAIVPFAMESVAFDLDLIEIFVWDDDADRVGSRIELAAHLQSGPRRGVGDEVDDCLMRGQRTTACVHGDVGEEAVLDLIPLGGSGWEVTDPDRQARFIGETL